MTRTIVVFSLEPWDDVWRRNQYLVHGLLERLPEIRVVFVEPARDHLFDLVTSRRTQPAAGLRTEPGYDGRLVRYQPAKWLPRALGPLADALLRAGVRRALRRVGATEDVLWINDPGWAHAVRRHRGPSLYDITDDWLAADRAPRELARLQRNEELLFQRCEAVVVCSPGLLRRKRAQRSGIVVIPNAVDVERYRQPHPRPADLPASPTALYVGTLHEDRLDVDVTTATARALREISGTLVFVGPDALSPSNRARLLGEPNITLLGARPRDLVPAYLQHADVLVVPHVVDDFTESLDPIKLYEYLAVTRPIVATAVAGFREESGPGRAVQIATAADFPRSVLNAVSDPLSLTPSSVASWDTRVTAFQAVVETLLPPVDRGAGGRRVRSIPSSTRYS